MNCANHSDTAAVAFCRTCGKPLCPNYTRDVRGVIYCESCLAARMEGAAPAGEFAPVPNIPSSNISLPNIPGPPLTPQPGYQPFVDPTFAPRTAASSGPNPAGAGILGGVFSFGLVISGADQAGGWEWIFVRGIMFFYVYQIIDSIRTAKAIQMGQPAPDPMGLGHAFNMGDKFEPGKVPVGAVVLIGLGVLFLLHTMGIMEAGFERYWPLIIVFLGGWMFYRHWERAQQRCQCGRCRTRWLMGPAMVLTTGVLFLLQSTDVADLGRAWPAWLLVVGIVKLMQSSASSQGHVGPLPPGPASIPPVPPQAPPPSGTESSSGEVNHV